MARKSAKAAADFNQLANVIQNHERNLRGSIADAVQGASEAGAEAMRTVIMNSGTGWVGRGPRATPTGRTDYGHMYDAVEVSDPRRHPKGTWASFGWIDPNKTEFYFKLQEEGFNAVEGMHALAAGNMVAKNRLESLLRTYKRRGRR